MPIESLGLKVRRVRAADAGPLVPFETEPAHPLENAGNHLVRRALRVGVFDAENKRAAVMPCEEPVEQRRARPADVQIPRW